MRILLALTMILSLAVGSVMAEVPNTMNYQGRLTDGAGDPVADDSYSIVFSIYDDETDGTSLWNSGAQSVATVDGLFNYALGSNEVFPADLFDDPARYLGIAVDSDPEMTPRTRLRNVPYSFRTAIDEPGIAQELSSTVIDVTGENSYITIISVTIDIPAPGYVVVEAIGNAVFHNTTGPNSMFYTIDKGWTSGTGNRSLYVGFQTDTPSLNMIYFPISSKRTYYETTAGSHTYRLAAHDISMVGTKFIYRPVITATYFPTSYGTVSTMVQDPSGDFDDAERVSIENPDGTSSTAYKVDLRSLELKTKEAQLRAREAELEALRLERELNQAKAKQEY